MEFPQKKNRSMELPHKAKKKKRSQKYEKNLPKKEKHGMSEISPIKGEKENCICSKK